MINKRFENVLAAEIDATRGSLKLEKVAPSWSQIGKTHKFTRHWLSRKTLAKLVAHWHGTQVHTYLPLLLRTLLVHINCYKIAAHVGKHGAH